MRAERRALAKCHLQGMWQILEIGEGPVAFLVIKVAESYRLSVELRG